MDASGRCGTVRCGLMGLIRCARSTFLSSLVPRKRSDALRMEEELMGANVDAAVHS